jgi:hypothetical protein
MGKPFGRWAMWSAHLSCWYVAVAIVNARGANAGPAQARGAGVVRAPVVLLARRALPDRVRRVIPENARRARWFYAGVVRSCGRLLETRDQRAEHAHAADRFAHEIEGFLAAVVMRSRRLMGKPLGGSHQRSAYFDEL